MRKTKTRRPAAGFTLLESLIVSAIVSATALLASELFLAAGKQATQVSFQASFLTAEQSALGMLRVDLRNASSSPAGGLAVTNSDGIVTPGPTTRGYTLTFRKPVYEMPATATGSGALTWGNTVTYTFQPMSTTTGVLAKEKNVVAALPPGATLYELTRSETGVNGGKPVTILQMIRYLSATNYPFFEVDGTAGQPRVNVCFEILQPVKEPSAARWSFYVRPVVASFKLQP